MNVALIVHLRVEYLLKEKFKKDGLPLLKKHRILCYLQMQFCLYANLDLFSNIISVEIRIHYLRLVNEFLEFPYKLLRFRQLREVVETVTHVWILHQVRFFLGHLQPIVVPYLPLP